MIFSYSTISKSLFVEHQIFFAFQIAITKLQTQNELDGELFQYFLSGTSSKHIQDHPENPNQSQFTSRQWHNIVILDSLQCFNGLIDSISQDTYQYEKCFQVMQEDIQIDSGIEEKNIPLIIKNATNFMKLVLIKTIFPNKFMSSLKQFINAEIGEYFIKRNITTLQDSFAFSTSLTPIILLIKNEDPYDELVDFAKEKRVQLQNVRVGLGMSQIAEKEIKQAMNYGNWVLMQNCHLDPGWLKKLANIIGDFSDTMHMNFRMFFITISTPVFPISIIEQSIIIAKDPQKGIVSNVQSLYQKQGSTKQQRRFFETCTKGEKWRTLFLSLAYFHALVRERGRFGTIGWNIYYDFNESDFRQSMRELKQNLEDYEQIPFQALQYMRLFNKYKIKQKKILHFKTQQFRLSFL